MDDMLKRELNTSRLRPFGSAGGGCINNGSSYEVDSGRVFVKHNEKDEAVPMFVGEEASLNAILATGTIRVPKPVKLLQHPDGHGGVLVMEHLDIESCSTMQRRLGENIARLHRNNIDRLASAATADTRVTGKPDSEEDAAPSAAPAAAVEKFGFDCVTCCGILPQENDWCESWPEFYARNRLQVQMDMVERNYGDREALTLWSEAQLKLDSFFAGVDVKPSLIHGDLWGGNIGQTSSEPVVFDPASCYGHHEFDLSIGEMFGGFRADFHAAYHKLVPKAAGFDKRRRLYTLFHYLNHWNHFGSGYRGTSMSLLREVAKGA